MVIGGSRAARVCVLCCSPVQEPRLSTETSTYQHRHVDQYCCFSPSITATPFRPVFSSDMGWRHALPIFNYLIEDPTFHHRPFCITDQVVNCLISIVCSMGPPHTPRPIPPKLGQSPSPARLVAWRWRLIQLFCALSLFPHISLLSDLFFFISFFYFFIVHPTSPFDGLRINTNMTSSELSPPRVGYLQVASTSAPPNTPRHPLRALHHPSCPRAAPPNLSHSARSKPSNTNLKSRCAPRISRMSPKRQSCG